MEDKKKQPFYKKKWFIGVIVFIVIAAIIGSENENKDDSSIEVKENSNKEISGSRKGREEPIAISDKSSKNLKISKIKNVPNDKTGNWKYVEINNSEELLPYTLDILDKNMQKSDVFFIINKERKEIYSVNDIGIYYNVTSFKYIDNEEKDAKTITDGPIIADYDIYKDNGDIYLLEIPDELLEENKIKENKLKEKNKNIDNTDLIKTYKHYIETAVEHFIEDKEMQKIKKFHDYNVIVYNKNVVHDMSGAEFPITFLITGRYEEKGSGKLNDFIMTLGYKEEEKIEKFGAYLLQYINDQTGSYINNVPEEEDVIKKMMDAINQ